MDITDNGCIGQEKSERATKKVFTLADNWQSQ